VDSDEYQILAYIVRHSRHDLHNALAGIRQVHDFQNIRNVSHTLMHNEERLRTVQNGQQEQSFVKIWEVELLEHQGQTHKKAQLQQKVYTTFI